MNIRKHVRVLAAALVLGTAILGISADEADAKRKNPSAPVDDGVRCVLTDSDGVLHFFLPGDTVDTAGGMMTCGRDGEWHPTLIRTDDPMGPRDGVFTTP